MADTKNTDMKDRIIEKALEDVPFDGWSMQVIENASKNLEIEAALISIFFPQGLSDVLAHFADWADRAMLERLEDIDNSQMRVRDRIKVGVLERLKVLEPHKEAVRISLNHWAFPTRQLTAGRILWRSADHIWVWAGDTATDYNHYTKRTLLGGVMGSTTLFWLNDSGEDLARTEEFLDRRIENVMQIGKIMGKIKKS